MRLCAAEKEIMKERSERKKESSDGGARARRRRKGAAGGEGGQRRGRRRRRFPRRGTDYEKREHNNYKASHLLSPSGSVPEAHMLALARPSTYKPNGVVSRHVCSVEIGGWPRVRAHFGARHNAPRKLGMDSCVGAHERPSECASRVRRRSDCELGLCAGSRDGHERHERRRTEERGELLTYGHRWSRVMHAEPPHCLTT